MPIKQNVDIGYDVEVAHGEKKSSIIYLEDGAESTVFFVINSKSIYTVLISASLPNTTILLAHLLVFATQL